MGNTVSASDARNDKKALYLNECEALALLEICMAGEHEDDTLRSAVLEKLGFLCREFIRQDVPVPAVAVHVEFEPEACDDLPVDPRTHSMAIVDRRPIRQNLRVEAMPYCF